MPKWKDVRRYCERKGWELYKNTDHYFYRKIFMMGQCFGQRFQKAPVKCRRDCGSIY